MFEISAFKILKEAVSKLPALKYALGVAGLAAVVAISISYKIDERFVVFGIGIVLAFMVLLLIFARLTKLPSKYFKLPALFLMWTLLVTFIAFWIVACSYILYIEFISNPKARIQVTKITISGKVIIGKTSGEGIRVEILELEKSRTTNTYGRFEINDVISIDLPNTITFRISKGNYDTLIRIPTDAHLQNLEFTLTEVTQHDVQTTAPPSSNVVDDPQPTKYITWCEVTKPHITVKFSIDGIIYQSESNENGELCFYNLIKNHQHKSVLATIYNTKTDNVYNKYIVTGKSFTIPDNL